MRSQPLLATRWLASDARLSVFAFLQYVQPYLMLAVLAVLPPGLIELQLASRCSGPVLTALSRFRRLQTLTMSGDASGVHWSAPGSAPMLPKLRSLQLAYSRYSCHVAFMEDASLPDSYALYEYSCGALPSDMPRWLAGATQLTSLELVVASGASVPELCRALPALREVRWVGKRLEAEPCGACLIN